LDHSFTRQLLTPVGAVFITQNQNTRNREGLHYMKNDTNLAAVTDNQNTRVIEFQPTSIDIWESKYQLRTSDGSPVDDSIEATYGRVAKALSEVETTPEKRHEQYHAFVWALQNGAIPAGRIISNAGASAYKRAVSLINCTVSKTIPDSMKGILEANTDAGITLKHGCGIGYAFSTIRHKGAFVYGAGADTNGPMAFMDIFDKMCFTVSSAGGRRGAQMGTFDVGHPDVVEFIQAKREDGRLRQFNLSLLITDDFMAAVKNGADWPLAFPVKRARFKAMSADKILYRDWPETGEDYVTNATGQVACEIIRTIPALELWDLIMQSTYNFAEPGFLLIDEINRMNNNWYCENIQASNPCGEQPLPPEGSCLLGSINLTKFVNAPFTGEASFDWDRYRAVVRVFTRMLDNVVDINGLALPGQRHEIETKRRHGMGYLGLGSTVSMLGLTYGDAESVAFTEEVTKQLALVGWEEALALSLEKGPAPALVENITITAKHLRQQPKLALDGIVEGSVVPARVLHAKYSRYMERIAGINPELVESLAQHGARFTHHSSIAPTGTISLSLGNNASNGIEPSFAHQYFRNVIKAGKKSKTQMEVASFELLAYRAFVNPTAQPSDLPANCVVSDTIDPERHVDIQAAAQKWIDSSISKTINVPTDFDYNRFRTLYTYAYDQRLKGCTTFRFNPEAFQGVLVRDEDLENTVYEFDLEDGTRVSYKGNERVMYDGEEHVVANLYDAIKEGTYGKY